MRNPPRRSRPKRPGATIDLKAETLGTVGYTGPSSAPDADDARPVVAKGATEAPVGGLDPEAQLASAVAPAVLPDEPPHTLSASEGAHDGSDAHAAEDAALPDEPPHGLPVIDDAARLGDEHPAGDTAGPNAATRAFAQEEGFVPAAPDGREGRQEEFDDETILAAAEPDPSSREDDPDRRDGAAVPPYDYNTATVPHQPDGRGGGFGSAFGAGLLGALLALLGAGALQYSGVLPSLGREDPAELAQQFASSGDVQQVMTDYGVLRADVEQLKSAQAAGGAGVGVTKADLNAVADRVTAIEQRANAAPAAAAAVPAADDGSKAVADEAARVATAAREAADGAKAAADQAAQAATTAAQTANAARTAADTATATLAGVDQAAKNASQAATTAQQTGSTAQAAAASAQQSATAANEAIAGLETRLTALEPRLAAIEPRIAGIEAGGRQAAAAIGAASLKAAIDRGGPFMGELETFAEIAGASPVVDTLRAHAATGVATAPALAGEWPATADAIQTALQPNDPNADIGNQILVGLGGLVTTRPAGGAAPATAEGPGAVVSRLNTAMLSGDLAGWLEEWQALPQPAKDASQAFQAKVEARVEADGIVGDTLNDAVKAVGQPVGEAG